MIRNICIKYYRRLERLNYLLGMFCGFTAFLMMLIIVYDVAMRYIFNSPTIWADEISCYLLVIISFLGAAYTDTKDGHIKVEMFVKILPSRPRHFILISAEAVTLLYLAVFTKESWAMVVDSYASHNISTTLLRTPMYIPQIFFALGVTLLAVHLFLKLLVLFLEKEEDRKKAGTDEEKPMQIS